MAVETSVANCQFEYKGEKRFTSAAAVASRHLISNRKCTRRGNVRCMEMRVSRGYIAGNAQTLETSGGREERIGVRRVDVLAWLYRWYFAIFTNLQEA